MSTSDGGDAVAALADSGLAGSDMAASGLAGLGPVGGPGRGSGAGPCRTAAARRRWRPSGIAWALAALGLAGACAAEGGLAGSGAGAAADPQALVGLTAQQATALLGEPELRRQEAPAEVWQYRTESCVLDLYLYREGDHHKVVYTEARHRSQGQLDPRRCVGQIVAEARAGRRTG